MELKSIVPWGRSFDEYREMFSLNQNDLSKFILGCGDGPASFNAGLTSRGGKVVSVDPAYCFRADELKVRIAEVYEEVMPQVQANQDKFLWNSIASPDALGKIRMAAMQEFLADYEKGKAEGRYIDAGLPSLDFQDRHFDLALCSHYLFLYSEHLGLEAHLNSLLELCRIAHEVRVYPLLTLQGELSQFLKPVISELTKLNYEASLVDVQYQFQKGATQMLVVKTN